MTKREFARQQVEAVAKSIGEIQARVARIEEADQYIRSVRPWDQSDAPGAALRRRLMEMELDQWRHLMQMGLCVDSATLQRIKAAAYDRFMAGQCVSSWLYGGAGLGSPSRWLAADEKAFAEACRKMFAPEGSAK